MIITEAEKYELEKTHLRYFDVTEHDLETARAERVGSDFASLATCECSHSYEVGFIFTLI